MTCMKIALIATTVFLSGWKIESFVDVFGDKVPGTKYLDSGEIKGIYKDSIIGRGDAGLLIAVTKKQEVLFFLHRKFFSIRSEVTAILTSNYHIQVKNKGRLLKFWGSMYQNSDRIRLGNPQKFINLLTHSNTFRIAITDASSYETFLFKVNANGFVRSLKKLK